MNKKLKDEIKFMTHAIKYKGKKAKVWYSEGELYNYPKGTITIYAKDYGNQLPEILNPKNDTEIQTDYFDKDKARILPTDRHYKKVKMAIEKQKALKEKLWQKRLLKMGRII